MRDQHGLEDIELGAGGMDDPEQLIAAERPGVPAGPHLKERRRC